MRLSWILILLCLAGFFGLASNIWTGFHLARDSNFASDQHLSIALVSIALLGLGNLSLIRVSHLLLMSQERDTLLEGSSQVNVQQLGRIQFLRGRAVSIAILLVVTALISLITGTISQSGRFPIIHGAVGILLSLIAFASIFQWLRFAKSYFITRT